MIAGRGHALTITMVGEKSPTPPSPSSGGSSSP